MALLDTLIDFNQRVFRNTAKSESHFHFFDDLSDSPADWEHVNKLTQSIVSTQYDSTSLIFHAIESVFAQETGLSSRFSNGQFPVWYGALAINTTFYETGFHWQHGLLADAGWQHYPEPIYALRTVFQTQCTSTLVDLRNKIRELPSLIQKNPALYQDTQALGQKLSSEGFPGLLFKSARESLGTNVAIFKKQVLSHPKHEGDFLYAIFPDKPHDIKILESHSRQPILTITF